MYLISVNEISDNIINIRFIELLVTTISYLHHVNIHMFH